MYIYRVYTHIHLCTYHLHMIHTYIQGLVYRGNHMVNWRPNVHTFTHTYISYIHKYIHTGSCIPWRVHGELEPNVCTYIHAYIHTYIHTYIQGLVYRGEYMVNWSPNLQTAVCVYTYIHTHTHIHACIQGLVYRGEYMVNWSPNLQTAVSDLEVEYSEEEGKLYFFKYPIAGGGPDDFLSVATVSIYVRVYVCM
jgi:valyl-tRNA synthetase